MTVDEKKIVVRRKSRYGVRFRQVHVRCILGGVANFAVETYDHGGFRERWLYCNDQVDVDSSRVVDAEATNATSVRCCERCLAMANPNRAISGVLQR